MKVSILEGIQLDFWVAKAQGLTVDVQNEQVIAGAAPNRYIFAPSTCWAQAGPIIEREQIDLVCDFGRWMAMHGKRHQRDYTIPHPSPLVAAMRAYLMWEYGDEVPDVV